MRILFVSTVFPSPWLPNRGTFNVETLRGLSDEHEIEVIAPVSWMHELQHRSRVDAFPTRSRSADGWGIHHPRYYYTPKLFRDYYADFMWHSVRRTVVDTVQRFQPDVVIGFWAHPDGEVATRAARLAGVPSVTIVGGSDVLLLGRNLRRRRVVMAALQAADAVITVSDHLRRTLVDYGMPTNRLSVLPTAINRDHFSPGDRCAARDSLGLPVATPTMLWVGHMVPVKGLEVLLEACSILKGQGRTFRLDLIGDGTERRKIEAARRRLQLDAEINLVGAVPHYQLPTWYRAADLTVLSSHSEGVPNVLLESIACGTPFVATRVGGIPEIADPTLDRLATPGSPSQLAAAIAERLFSPSPSNLRKVQPCTRSELARRLTTMLSSLISAKAPAPPPPTIALAPF